MSLPLLIALALGLPVVLAVLGWAIFVPLVARQLLKSPRLPAVPCERVTEHEPFQIKTADGLRLEGSVLPPLAVPRIGTIVFCHELAADRWSAVPYTSELRALGFAIVAFDFRNHGSSERLSHYDPSPWPTSFDVADVQAAIDFAARGSGSDECLLGLMGVSRGGAVALFVAADDPRIGAVVTDGAYFTEGLLVHYMRYFAALYASPGWLFSRLPDVLLASVGHWALWKIARRERCRFVHVENAARRVRQPVLLIHGEADPFVPLAVAEKLRGHLPARPRFWGVRQAKHNTAILVAPERYHRRVTRFFRRHLVDAVQPTSASV